MGDKAEDFIISKILQTLSEKEEWAVLDRDVSPKE
jgi:hypothetical protein